MTKAPLWGLRNFRWIVLSAGVGMVAGAGAVLFLHLLEIVSRERSDRPVWIWILPLAGIWIGWLYERFGKNVAQGHNLILEEIHDPRNVLPARMAPIVLGSTLLTHLGGGSAGREGAAVQIGASLADQLARLTKLEALERRVLLMAASGAAFGAAIGAPLAGVLFGMEVVQGKVGRLRLFAWRECVIASASAYLAIFILRAPHAVYAQAVLPDFQVRILPLLFLAAILFGLAARSFVAMVHLVECIFFPLRTAAMRAFLGGLLLLALYWLEGSFRYIGLGIEHIQSAFEVSASWRDPLFKAFFTSLTVGTGFKGGEFTPLVFIGATLGSFFAAVADMPLSFLAGLGFAAVFGAAANTPLSCALMAGELFGWRVFPFALPICLCAYAVSGSSGIYRAQKSSGRKSLIGLRG